jgi:hypothetical protein
MMRRVRGDFYERGVVLVLALLLITAGTLVAMAAMTSSDIEMMISGNQRSQQQVFDAAEAGIDVGIMAFFRDAPPWGSRRPPFTDRPCTCPWGVADTESLPNACQHTVWITDMEVSKPPPPGNDPNRWRTYYYRIDSYGREPNRGANMPGGVRKAEQVVGVVYAK